jgi:hypothetical protein
MNIFLTVALLVCLFVLVALILKRRAMQIKEFTWQEKDRVPKILLELEKGGAIEMELYPDSAPGHVASFLELIENKFYDGLTFHR